VVQLTCCFVKVLTLKTLMINCHFHEFDVTEVRAFNNNIIISIIIVEIVLHFVCVILFTFLRITCKTEEHSRSG
jgi:hypothetical protein